MGEETAWISTFERRPLAQPYKILSLIAMHSDEPRTDKIDLGVGIHHDALGATPVMKAVREVERRLWDGQATKTYLGMAPRRSD